MAYDEGLAHLLRDDLEGREVTEMKMFGGIAFMLLGNMVCGIHKGGAMFRVGKASNAAALAIPGTSPMIFTGKPMAGFVACDDDCAADDARRGALMALALAFVHTLPPK